MALSSSAVSAGDKAKATQYNNLRTDLTSHTHDGADTARIPAVDTGWSEIYSAGTKLAWTYASADDPTYTFTIAGDWTGSLSEGMKVKLTQTTVKYFIITKVAYGSPNTTVTVYGGTDYDLANAAISAHYFSCSKAPQGFPLDPDKWSVEVTDTTIRTQANPVANTWYNLGSTLINIPIGIWKVFYSVTPEGVDSGGGQWDTMVTLSTANNSESNKQWSCFMALNIAGAAIGVGSWVHREGVISIATKDIYYLNMVVATANLDDIYFRGDKATTVICATCAFL